MSKRLSDVKWDPVNQEYRLEIDPATAVVGPTDDGVYQSYLLLLPIIESNRNGAHDNGFAQGIGFDSKDWSESLRDSVQ